MSPQFIRWITPARSRMMLLLLAGAAIAAPVVPDVGTGQGPWLSPAFAHARGGDDSGGDDSGGDDHGGGDRGGDDRDGDDHGGRGGDDRNDDHGGRDDDRDDDRGGDDGRGRGRGGDDDRDDDHGRGRGRDDDHAGGPVGTPGDRTPTRYERSAEGIEVTYADGWREELESGRYELKDPQNRTVVERPATRQDYERLSAIPR